MCVNVVWRFTSVDGVVGDVKLDMSDVPALALTSLTVDDV